MITFSSVQEVIQILNHLKVDNTKEEQSAVNCILIEQLDKRITRFTTYEPKVGTFQRLYRELNADYFGDTGDSYLVDYSLFEKTFSAFKGYSRVTIRIEGGMLVFYANLYEDSNGKEHFASSKSCSLYPGDRLDFKPTSTYVSSNPLDSKQLLGYINSPELQRLVQLVDDCGEFKGTNETYSYTLSNNGRAVLLELNLDSLSIFSEDKSRSVWFSITEPACFDKKQSIQVEGRNLGRLNNLFLDTTNSHPINIYKLNIVDPDTGEITAEWLQFEAGEFSNYFRIITNVVSTNNKQVFESHRDTIPGTVRTVIPWLLRQSFTNQHDKDRAHQQYLLLFDNIDEASAEFVVKDTSKFAYFNRDKAVVEIKEHDGQPWAPIGFPYFRINKFLDILERYYSYSKANPLIDLELKGVEVKINATDTILQWRLYGYPQYEQTKLCVCCGAVDIAELNIQTDDSTNSDIPEPEPEPELVTI